MNSFKEYAKSRWKEYLFPVLAPVVVFMVSFLVTNIGWRAIPMAIVVGTFMALLKTLEIYNTWYVIEGTMRAIKADGRVRIVDKE